jgi:hypothetical protein
MYYRGLSTIGKRSRPATVRAMPQDASLCSYNSIRSSGGFELEVSLSYGSTLIQSKSLLDSGASTCFIDIAYVHAHNIPIVCTSQPIPVESICQGQANSVRVLYGLSDYDNKRGEGERKTRRKWLKLY